MSTYHLTDASECSKAQKNLSIKSALQIRKNLSFHDNGKSIESTKALQLYRRPTPDERRPSSYDIARPLALNPLERKDFSLRASLK